MDKTSPSGRLGINLENSSSSEVGPGILEEAKLLFDRDSCSSDAMKSITPSNKKDNAYIDNI